MKIVQEFTVARPLPVVWDFFKDLPTVASCMPGAEYIGTSETGLHQGKVSTKVGPFQTNFEGEAEVTFDDETKTITSAGKGVDKKGASRGKMTIVCTLVPNGSSTNVSVDADVQLSGSIAQFGRTGLLQDIAGVMIKSFVNNAEAHLAEPTPSVESTEDGSLPKTAPAAAQKGAAPKPLSVTSIIWLTIKARFARMTAALRPNRS